ncbi:7-hydroxymethyl chlorophyll a reductase, chloroplastic [Seminavis robusta]|uniref:7-hydroxymethyl chlorophyll a reductase, chloroplastic n=1 Tax=Seminavis robusta TaxID=568900 RepID=A0A9N8H6E7_9STRA|nr:7-hydroxymethyl chlorophyll a reductase, chloroplastic [Seminavis robusta]|eukprot:Sro169_g075020.1 7-hydroxymethyl chlorophyll a reductase, chloroplastic (490) ;mRNA; r:19480-21081
MSMMMMMCLCAIGLLSFCLEHVMALASLPSPISGEGWPEKFPAKEHCSRCGLCETTFVSRVKEACAFLGDGMGRVDDAEMKVHGRQRDTASMAWSENKDRGEDLSTADEARFGVMHEPMRLAKGIGMRDAQWTGVVTSIALSMLEAGKVDAVVCIANSSEESNKSNPQAWSYPQPILAKTPEDVLRGRGVKPALSPSLNVLDEIKNDKSIRKLLFCGVGCAVQAFRAVQDDLGLEEVYVLGTNCVDNSPTPEAAQNFLQEGVQISELERVRGYEFMQDFKVHVKTSDGYITRPYFSLPGTVAAPSIATSCLACFDYTNGLADVVVGYMGAPLDGKMDESYQTLTIRNERGSQMVETAKDANRLYIGDVATGTGNHEQLATSTVAADSIVLEMVGGDVPTSGMPVWMGNILAFVISNYVSPKGVNFARYSIDYHILRNYLHILQEWGEDRAQQAMPQYAADIVSHYLQDETVRKLQSQLQITKQEKELKR